MLKDIIQVNPYDSYQLYLKFEDGKEGIVDVNQLIEFTGIFAPLKDLNYFKTVKLNAEIAAGNDSNHLFGSCANVNKFLRCISKTTFSSKVGSSHW